MKEIFEKLSAIDISGQIEKKENLSYLSWANAWTLLVQNYPDSNYTVHQYNGKPYIFDENLGYMVHTSVTVENITKDMYLPVLDGKNKAMLNVDYSYTTKYGNKTVNKATMFDINTSIMRCFVKNIALFGLGLSLYRGEDIVQDQDHINTPKAKQNTPQGQNQAPQEEKKKWFNLKTKDGAIIKDNYKIVVKDYNDGLTSNEIIQKLEKDYTLHFTVKEQIKTIEQNKKTKETDPFDGYEEIVLVD